MAVIEHRSRICCNKKSTLPFNTLIHSGSPIEQGDDFRVNNATYSTFKLTYDCILYAYGRDESTLTEEIIDDTQGQGR